MSAARFDLHLQYGGWRWSGQRMGLEAANPIMFHSTSLALNRLSRIESVRWRERLQLLRIWDKLEALAVQLLGLGGEAHAQNEHGEWLVYRIEREDPEWVTWFVDRREEAAPAEPKHLGLGQQIHDLYRFVFHDNGRRRVVAEVALEYCIQSALAAQVKRHGRVARIPINGRDYWYTCEVDHRSGFGEWKRMLWPEDDSVEVKVP